MNIQTFYFIAGIISTIVGMIFSFFMMYTMYQTYKQAKKIEKNLKETAQTLTKGMENIGAMIGNQFAGNQLTEDSQILHEEYFEEKREIPPGGFLAEEKVK